MKLLELVSQEAIIPELAGEDRSAVIRELVGCLAASGQIRADAVDSLVRSIVSRERTATTGIGKGVAIPHAKLEGQPRVVAAVGRSSKGVDFSSLDREPVFAVFLVISPNDQPTEHLKAMDIVYRNLQQERFRKFLRQLDDAAKIYDLLKEADERPIG